MTESPENDGVDSVSCPNCGAPLEEGVDSCSYCEAEISGLDKRRPGGSTGPGTGKKDGFDMKETWDKAGKDVYQKKVKIIFIILGIVIVLLTVAYFAGLKIFPGM